MGMFNVSAIICIINGDFFATPPMPIKPLTGTPCSLKRSTIALAPKQVASTNVLKTRGASVPKFKPVIAALNN
jgi:hypothetical protein